MRTAITALALVAASATSARAYINHSADADWDKLIDAAKAEDGWKFDRSCFPKEKPPYCTLTMSSPESDGKTITLLEAYDINDQMTGRAICIGNTSGIAMTRHCYYVDQRVETEEMYDTSEKEWHDLSKREYSGYVPAPHSNDSTGALNSSPNYTNSRTSYTAVKEWEQQTSSGTFIHRSLYAGSDGSMRLFATERDARGNRVTSSTCNFNQTWSDCINQAGAHYQLKPGSIASFYSMRSGR